MSSEVVPYRVSQHLKPWKASVFTRRFWRHPEIAILTAVMSALLGTFTGGLVGMMIASITTGGIMPALAMLGIPVALIAFPVIGADYIGDIDRNVVSNAKTRVLDFAQRKMSSRGDSMPELTDLRKALGDERLVTSADGRPLLFQLDAVMLNLNGALVEIGPHTAAIEEAEDMALKAVLDILRRHGAELARRHADATVMERLATRLHEVSAGRIGDEGVMPTAPSARISRIVETAERGLRTHPDMVDAQGARIDDLVRKHVPRLLQIHADAARTAPASEIAAVDGALDEAVEAVRGSVDEALGRMHDEAMDALRRELHFLALRRGTPTALTAVA